MRSGARTCRTMTPVHHESPAGVTAPAPGAYGTSRANHFAIQFCAGLFCGVKNGLDVPPASSWRSAQCQKYTPANQSFSQRQRKTCVRELRKLLRVRRWRPSKSTRAANMHQGTACVSIASAPSQWRNGHVILTTHGWSEARHPRARPPVAPPRRRRTLATNRCRFQVSMRVTRPRPAGPGNHRKGFLGGGPHTLIRASDATWAMSSRFSWPLRIIHGLTHPLPQNPTARPW